MQRVLHGRDGIEERPFVFLEVAMVGGRQSFQRRQDRQQISVEPARLAARQFGHVRIFLLRHQTGAGRERVAKINETEFGRAPENQFLAEPREMHADHGQAEEKLSHEIAIPDRVETVLAELRETEFARDRFAVEDDGRAGDGAGTERENVRAPGAIDDSGVIAFERFDVGEEIMR